jgi:quinoprotein glucose dehydrogenase
MRKKTNAGFSMMNVCRGVIFYTDDKDNKRIYYAAGAKLYCINAITGEPITTFGSKGGIDLHQDLGLNAQHLYVAATSPGIIYKNLIIIGTRVAEEMPAAPGDVLAYDVYTGHLQWIFHTIPHSGESGFNSWKDSTAYLHVGGANAWAGFSMDEEIGIVYVPTGSAVYDFYGGLRLGNNLFVNSLIVLNANNGKEIWHYQTIHHDVWDRDLPTAPALLTLNLNGRKIDAVAQPTKTGYIFLFNRLTGEPIFPIHEQPVPAVSLLKGEMLSTTQPVPVLPVPFVRQSLTKNNLNHLVPHSSYNDIAKRLSCYQSNHMCSPPSGQGTIIFPGFDGGAEWGGPAVDPLTGILYINANEIPWVLKMLPITFKNNNHETMLQAGIRLYQMHCMSCHGATMQGSGNYPSLKHLFQKYELQSFIQFISSGRRMMPFFNNYPLPKKGFSCLCVAFKK